MKHAKIAADLLDIASDLLSRRGCNDYSMEATPENIQMIHDMHKWDTKGLEEEDPDINIHSGQVHTYDWFVAMYLAHLLREEAER